MQPDLRRLQRPTDAQAVGRHLLKSHLQLGTEHARAQANRQTGRHIGQPGRQVQAGQAQLHRRLPPRRKWGGLRARLKAAAIQKKRQLGLHRHRPLSRQIAQKRQAELQLPHRVPPASPLVVNIEPACRQRQVVQGKAGRGCVGWGTVSQKSLQDVINVVAPVTLVGESQRRPLDSYGIQHWRQAPQRFQRRIYIEALHKKLGCPVRLAWGRANHQLMQHQLQ